MKPYTRKAIFSGLKDYCIHAGEHDFIEVTEWTNGDGVDVLISSKTGAFFQMTYGEARLLKKLIKILEKS